MKTTTGQLFVNHTMDREFAETIELTLLVEDLNAYFPRPQNDTGEHCRLIIRIIRFLAITYNYA